MNEKINFDTLWHFLTKGKPEDVQDYINKGNDINILNNNKDSVLFEANTNLIQILINGGVDVNHTNMYGHNALFFADFEISKILIENNINYEQLTEDKENVLFYWSDTRRHESSKFKLLLEKGINYNQINIYNEHILFRANSWLTDVILFDKGNISFDVNQLNKEGNHCLFEYLDNDYYQKLFLLVKAGFNPDYIVFDVPLLKGTYHYDFFVSKKLEQDSLKEKELIQNMINHEKTGTSTHIKKRI